MLISTMTRAGRITLPKEVREHLHLKPGDQVEFRFDSGGAVVLRPFSSSIPSLSGILKRHGDHAATVEEMDEAVGRYLAEDDERISRREDVKE